MADSAPRVRVAPSPLNQAGLAALLLRTCWRSVAKAADQRLPALVLPDAVAAVGLNIGDVCEIFSHFAGDPEVKKRPYLRAYVEGQMVPVLERKIWQSPIDEQSPFQDWFRNVFKSEHCGLVLNRAERWGLSASQKLARWLQPRVIQEDHLRLGLEIVVFAGDYGFTPFGVHRDEPCSSVIHFNLGPNPKDIYIFEDEAKLGNLTSIKDASRYRIAPGDGFILPANYAHIGDAATFSVDISCKLMFRSNEAALAFIAAPLLDGEHDIVGGDADLVELLLRRLGVGKRDEPISTMVEHWMTASGCRAQSNALFVGVPITAQAKWGENSLLKVDQAFPLVFHDREGQLTLFSRGRSFVLANNNSLLSGLELLRGSGRMQAIELLQHSNTPRSAHDLIDFLVTSRGVTVSD